MFLFFSLFSFWNWFTICIMSMNRSTICIMSMNRSTDRWVDFRWNCLLKQAPVFTMNRIIIELIWIYAYASIAYVKHSSEMKFNCNISSWCSIHSSNNSLRFIVLIVLQILQLINLRKGLKFNTIITHL